MTGATGGDRAAEEAPGSDPAAERFDDRANRYDALLVVSFGGPEGMDDVMPFLDNVLRGLALPDHAKRRIAKRYEQVGGVSPINAHTRELIGAVREGLERGGPALPVYWGNRNWHPLLPDTLRRMEADGVGRALVFVTSLFGSYNGCRKYREDLYEAVQGLDRPPHVDRLRHGYNHPGFIEACADRVRDALARLPEARRGAAPILFTAHSLPRRVARRAPYERQLREAAGLVADVLGGGGRGGAGGTGGGKRRRWRLAYQSRNASYGPEGWLEPDVGDALAEERERGARDVVVAPIGFVCDHLEVTLDLDVRAKQRAEEAGLNMVRAATVGTHPAFVDMIRDLIRERMAAHPARAVAGAGAGGPSHDFCPPDCCLSGRPGPPKPALGGAPAAPPALAACPAASPASSVSPASRASPVCSVHS